MGEAADKPPAPSTPEVVAVVPPLEAVGDDLLKFFEDSFPVLCGDDAKQGKKEGVEEEEEEEEEELEWLNMDAFPPLDTSLAFGSIPAADALKALENVVVDELAIEKKEEGETGELSVPRKRRSQGQRLPRKVYTNLPSQWVKESKKEKKISVRSCTHCKVDETPQWRQGPQGPGTLCNACGVRYKSGRLFDEYRPANSPTFSPLMHSNFHRKVEELRERQSRLGGSERDGRWQ